MKVFEVMQRIGTTETNLTIAYIKDALREIQEITRENIVSTYIDIVNGVSDYHYPFDMVKLISLKINEDIADYADYFTENYGKTFKLWKKDYSGKLIATDSNETDGIFLEYTSTGMEFVHNPDGDSDYYSHLASDGSQELTQDTSVVFLDVATGAPTGALSITSHYYSYLKGDADTDGSVRFAVLDGVVMMQKRVSGFWIELKAWGDED